MRYSPTLRCAVPTLLLLLLAQPALAGPVEDLAKAKTELAASHTYGADALLQGVVKAPDASRAQVEEALYLQTMIYYGDVFGASLILPSVTAVAQKTEAFGGEVAQQVILARRAFSVSAGAYLNITAAGSSMKTLKVQLPPMTDADVKKIQGALADRPTIEAILSNYGSNPAQGKGMLARANQFGLYLGFASAMPKTPGRKMEDISAKLRGGVTFDPLRHLDWLASVSIDMSKMVKDPQAPDMLALAKRADERLLQVGKDKPDSQFVKNAKARGAKYGW